MNIVTWQRPLFNNLPGFGRLSDLRNEIDRLFESPLTELTRTAQLLNRNTPALNVQEDQNNYIVTAELPGMKKEDIDVSLEDGTLSLSGERKSEPLPEGAEVRRAERRFGKFQRSVTLPSAVAADKVQATYKDGILTITLPKTEEAKPKQIDVSFN